MKTLEEKYQQVKKDYKWLCANYDQPYDLTGGYVEGDKFIELLENPTKKKALEIYSGLIQYGFQRGNGVYAYEYAGTWMEVHISENRRLNQIYNRWVGI